MKRKSLCRWWANCKGYDKRSITCNCDEGFYGKSTAGCYRDIYFNKKKSKWWKK